MRLIRNLSLGSALLLSAAHAAGDFCPLAVGNTWVYGISESGGGFAVLNPNVRQSTQRTLRVESRTEGPGGNAGYILSYRDSLYQRSRAWSGGSSQTLPDTVASGRFQVDESAADGRLSLRALGDPIPSRMEMFFRRRFRAVETEGSGGDSLLAVPIDLTYPDKLKDKAVYARDVGLLFFNRHYDLWGRSRYTPGYTTASASLLSFNGRPVAGATYGTVPPAPPVTGFSGLRAGRSWRYRGLRQVLPSYSLFYRDSIVRELKVTAVSSSQGNPRFELSFKDSVYQRSINGQPGKDSVETGSIRVTVFPDSTFVEAEGGGSAPYDLYEPRNELYIQFQWNSFPDEALGFRDFGNGPVRIMEYRENFPGFLDDSWLFAEGIGLVRRAKFLLGPDSERSERHDWRLIELDGKPFEAGTATALRGPAPQVRPIRTPSTGWKWFGRLHNLLGRAQEP